MTQFLLGIIAAAVVAMAVVQVGGAVVALRMARRLERLSGDLERQIRPLLANAASVTENAARVAAVAVAQAERVDRLTADLAARVEAAADLIERGMLRPARQGVAIVRGIQAVVDTLRRSHSRAGGGRTSEEDDALFIG